MDRLVDSQQRVDFRDPPGQAAGERGQDLVRVHGGLPGKKSAAGKCLMEDQRWGGTWVGLRNVGGEASDDLAEGANGHVQADDVRPPDQVVQLGFQDGCPGFSARLPEPADLPGPLSDVPRADDALHHRWSSVGAWIFPRRITERRALRASPAVHQAQARDRIGRHR